MKHRAIVYLACMAMLHSAGAALAAAAAPGHQITDPGVVAGYENSFAYGLSDNGRQVAGWVDNGSTTQAFVWSAATGMQLLGNSTGATAARGFSVNDRGMVVGHTSFGTQREATVWAGSTPSGLGSSSNAGSRVAFGVDDAGKIVGWSDSPDGTCAYGYSNQNSWVTGDAQDPTLGDVAFIWSPVGSTVSLGRLSGATRGFGAEVNSDGAAVGWAE